MTLFNKTAAAVRVSEFFGRGLKLLWMQFALLVALSVAQHGLALLAVSGGDTNLLETASYALLLAAFVVLGWLGHEAVSKANGTAFTAIVTGALFFPASALAGFLAYFALGGRLLDVSAVAYSLTVSLLLGAVFSGIGGVIARVQSGFWLKH